MKRIALLLAVILLVVFSGQAMAAGSCVQTNVEDVAFDGAMQRRYVTLTCTGDGTIAAYTFSPSAYGVRGWFLYNITTNPGSSAPTADYDITLVVDGEDVAGGLLADRSTSATQTVAIASSTQGYHMADQSMAITFANEVASPSTIVLKLRFTKN